MFAAMGNLFQIALQRPAAEGAGACPWMPAFGTLVEDNFRALEYLSARLELDQVATLRVCAD
jgi:hypothetical protein